MKFEGIYTPLVAPFFDDFTLNHDAMQQTVDLLVNAGVHGIIVAGTTCGPCRQGCPHPIGVSTVCSPRGGCRSLTPL